MHNTILYYTYQLHKVPELVSLKLERSLRLWLANLVT